MTFFKQKISAVFLAAIAFAIFPVTAFPQQASRSQLAGMMEDIAALRSEVQRLRAEIEDLRTENARVLDLAQKKNTEKFNPATAFASFRIEVGDLLVRQKREITTETDQKIARLATETNRALADFAKQVNRQPPEKTFVAPPADMPQSGIEYSIKPGDTISAIAARNGSKLNWILAANPGLKPERLMVGQKIFIPQKN